MVADDLDDPQRRDGQDHTGYAPDQVAGNSTRMVKIGWMLTCVCMTRERYIKLNSLNQCISHQYAHHHVEAPPWERAMRL